MEHLRTSEDERQRVVSFLSDCCAGGYLDVDELDERQSRVLRSRTRGELAGLVSDMPGGHAVLPGALVFRRPPAKPRGSAVPVLIAGLVLLAVMVVGAAPVPELLMLGVFALMLLAFAVMVLVVLSPWLAVGALVAWSVNRLRHRAPPPQLR